LVIVKEDPIETVPEESCQARPATRTSLSSAGDALPVWMVVAFPVALFPASSGVASDFAPEKTR
jgi:hypothetical protein